MVKLLFFHFRIMNSRLKNKQFNFELLTRWVHFPVTNVKLINEKKSFKYYSSNVRERLEIDDTPQISKSLL